MINSSNIITYIQFLYFKKYKTEAPKEVLNSWENIPNESINGYLQELYQHWDLSNLEAQAYERKFLNIQSNKTLSDTPYNQPVTAAPKTQQHNYQQPPPKAKSSWRGIIIFLFLALLGIIAYLAFNLMNPIQNEEFQTVETSPAPVNPKPVTESKPAEPITEAPLNQADIEKTMTIRHLLNAEENRDMNGILSTFSTYMERYWDINYPTEDELINAYQKTWEITKDNKNTNIRIKKVSDNTFDVSNTYSYFSLKEQKSKTVNSTIRFIFDEDNKIVNTYGLK